MNKLLGVVKKRITSKLSASLLCMAAAAVSAQAGITFNYGSLANNATDAQIQSFMNGKLSGGASVTVTGAVASNSYTGDGHAVGPCTGSSCSSVTLDNTDGTFIMNASGSNQIDMTFSGLKIYSVSFDYEIFPDGTCANGNNGCGSNWPDLTFTAGGTTYLDAQAVMPGTHGTYSHSPASGSTSNETAPQLIGSWAGNVGGSAGVTTLDFIDWPATIAIDNLQINTVSPTPEPSAIVLFGSVALLFGWMLRKRFAQLAK